VNLLCIDEFRSDEKVLKIFNEATLLNTKDQSGNIINQAAVLPIKVSLYNRKGEKISLSPSKFFLSFQWLYKFVEFKGAIPMPAVLALEVVQSYAPHQAFKTVDGNTESSMPVAGSTLSINHDFKVKMYPLPSGRLKAEWVDSHSQMFKKSTTAL
jgi:hypothetical protein